MKLTVKLGLLFFLFSLVLVGEVKAGSASATLGVSVTVNNNCTISTASVAFGSYDPIVSNATSPLDGTGTVTISCTKGAATSIGIGASGGTIRQMSSGLTNLTYGLYKDSGRTAVWGSSGADLLDAGVAPSRNPRSFTVNGRIPAGQDVPAGSYSDAVVATVNF